MIKFIKRLRCKHENLTTISNFYGDAINYFGCRSMKQCDDCGKIIKSDCIDKDCKKCNFQVMK